MSHFEERFKKYLESLELNKICEESEDQYEKDRDGIIADRLHNLEKNPDSAIHWKDIKRK